MSETAQIAKEKPEIIYDADARNRFEYTVRHDGLKYDVAHIFKPLSDERYLKWIREFNVSGSEDEISEESREASARLWDDQIIEVENVEFEEGVDWKSCIPSSEKIEALNDYLAVAIADEDAGTAVKKLKLQPAGRTQKVLTEAYSNGEITKQTHILQDVSFEMEKKYARIQGKRFKSEQQRGFRRSKAKITYIPQDEKIGELYDEMFISQEGFANGVVPLRFKTTVVHHIFEPKLDPKKSER